MKYINTTNNILSLRLSIVNPGETIELSDEVLKHPETEYHLNKGNLVLADKYKAKANKREPVKTNVNTNNANEYSKKNLEQMKSIFEKNEEKKQAEAIEALNDEYEGNGADASKYEAIDKQQILKAHGKLGATQMSVSEAISSDINEIEAIDDAVFDDSEHVHRDDQIPADVIEFLKQDFSEKKKSISVSEDKKFLSEILKISKSSNVKSLIRQRMKELGE